MPSLIDENTQYLDQTTGELLVNGKIYIGTPGLDPKILANQITIYSDRALTTAISNPQITNANGQATNKIWVPGKYALAVTDSADVQKYINTDNGTSGITTPEQVNSMADLIALDTTRFNAASLISFHSTLNKGGGEFYYDSTQSRANHNGITIIDPTNTANLALWDATAQTTWFTVGTGSGCWMRIYNGSINVLWAGSKLGSFDNSKSIQGAIDYAESIVSSVNNAVIACDVDLQFSSTLTVTVSTESRIPDINFTGTMIYTGVDTQPAIVIGETSKVIFEANINLAVTKQTNSDWTQAECIGIRLINANACSNINIREASKFTVGLECSGNNQGFVYNNVSLGDMNGNQYGVDLKPSGTGWVNENNFIGGRFTVFTGVNSTLSRYGVRLGVSGLSQVNNNIFLKPSFELNQADTGAGKTFGVTMFDSIQNHIINCRSEGTEVVAVFDAGCDENEVTIGYSNSTSHAVTNNGFAGNVVKYSRQIAEYNSKTIFEIDNLRNKTALHSAGINITSGMVAVDTTTGVLKYNGPTVTLNAEDITITSATRAMGAVVDTSENKQFMMSCGYTGSGGRLYVVCYDANDLLLTGTAPSYAIGKSNNTLSVSGNGYRSGSDSTSNVVVEFHDNVKRAFIGISKGTLSPQLNSFRISSIDDPDYVVKTPILEKTPTASIKPDFVYSDVIPTSGTWLLGDRVWNISPSVDVNNMVLDHWICTVAGTPGTWVAQYVSTVSPAN